MHRLFSLRSDAAWIIIGALMIGALVQLRPVDDRDILTQVRLGQLQRASLQLIEAEPFSWALEGRNIENPGWLAQVFYSWLYDQGGWRLARFVHSLLFAGAFLAAGIWARRMQCGRYSDFSLFFGLLLSAVVGMSNCSLRPHGIALFGFCTFLLIAEIRAGFFAKALLVSIIGLLWQNCHSSLVLGVLVFAVYAAGAGWRWIMRRSPGVDIVAFAGLSAAAFALQYATPLASGYTALSRKNLHISRELLGISEWLPAWDESVAAAMSGFWALAAVSVVVLAVVRPKHVRIEALLLYTLFLGASLWAARFALFWGIAALPVICVVVEAVRPTHLFNWEQTDLSASVYRVAAFACAVMLAAGFWVLGSKRPTHDPQLPLACVDKLREAQQTSRIYNYREWGGMLAFYGEEDWKIGLDGRLYLFSEDDFRRYEQEAMGLVAITDIENRYSPTAFLLRSDYHKRLVELLQKDSGWNLECEDGRGKLFLPSHELVYEEPS